MLSSLPILKVGRDCKDKTRPQERMGLFMMIDIVAGILIPLLGTALGASCVFFMRGEMNKRAQSALVGFAAGIMVAASVWSLLIPAIERAAPLGCFSFLPAAAGLFCGMLFLLILDTIIPRLYAAREKDPSKSSMLVLAVTLHNLPEGMAVGAVFAGLLAGEQGISSAGALALSIGIAIQNFPEGAIISMPRYGAGVPRGRAFSYGVLSGVVEPIGAALTILAASVIVPALPVLLSFAAGAMLYVVVEELIPEVAEHGHSYIGNIMFAVGFSLMMALDVALG